MVKMILDRPRPSGDTIRPRLLQAPCPPDVHATSSDSPYIASRLSDPRSTSALLPLPEPTPSDPEAHLPRARDALPGFAARVRSNVERRAEGEDITWEGGSVGTEKKLG